MRHRMGWLLAGLIAIGLASRTEAQVSVVVGNPYYGQGVAINAPGYAYGPSLGYNGYSPYGYNTGFRNYANPVYPGYSSGYGGYANSAYVAGPGSLRYSSGYQGYAPPVIGPGYPGRVNPYGYANRPYYGAYGYGNYSNGSTDGFRPFRGVNSWLSR